jgi:glycerol uptake facilitator-like aquaporin
MNPAPLPRRLLAEFLGSAFLAATVVGSGIAASQLSSGDTGLQLLENAVATAAGLFTFILMFGPVSGGHFNPVVSLIDASFGGVRWRHALAYIPAQVSGCIAGAIAANVMFSLSAVSISTTHRASGAHLFAEAIATLGLLLVTPRWRGPGAATWRRPPSVPISAPPTSSPARPASPTPRSTSGACSPTPSPASPPPRYRPTSSFSSLAG